MALLRVIFMEFIIRKFCITGCFELLSTPQSCHTDLWPLCLLPVWVPTGPLQFNNQNHSLLFDWCWVDFQRQQPQTTSHVAGVCTERTLANSCTWTKALSSLPQEPKVQDVTRTWTQEHFQKLRVYCPGRSGVDAPYMDNFQVPPIKTCPTSSSTQQLPPVHSWSSEKHGFED